MAHPRAAIYARQSIEEEAGIDRQLRQCSAEIKRRGWGTPVERYKDNNTSASQQRGARTAWSQMLADHAEGRFDVLVAVNVDRVLRRIEDVILLKERGVRVVTVDGDLDLSTESGEFFATMLAALARFEVRRKAARAARAGAERRAAGHPKSGRPPYGYEWVPAHTRSSRVRDGLPFGDARYEVVEDEAAHVRWAFEQLTSGVVTIGAIQRGLADRGARTRPSTQHQDGTVIGASTVRRLLLNPVYAALLPPSQGTAAGAFRPERVNVERVTPGAWPAIVSADQWRAARSILLAPGRRTNGGLTARKHLLSGIAVCAECGEPVRSAATRLGDRAYRCRSERHFSRKAQWVDQWVNDVVVDRLRHPELVRALVKPSDHASVQSLVQERAALTSSVSRLVEAVAADVFTVAEAKNQRQQLDARLKRVDEDIAQASRTDPLAKFVGDNLAKESSVLERWEQLGLHQKRAIVTALFEKIELRSIGPGARVRSAREAGETIILRWRDKDIMQGRVRRADDHQLVGAPTHEQIAVITAASC
ncbi:recombinase family protein [Amnibacterium endophyticum]|uniref:Recombinase family protein n=1 Tax=Amnibacterium endophyticum TaxID=2109337 RepID=A0ABW4LBL6_9MICO